MSLVQQWMSQADDHLQDARKLRNVARRRLDIMDRTLAELERVYSHPEMIFQLNHSAAALVNIDDLESISKAIERMVEIERKATSAHLNDINMMARALDRLGYKIVPRQEIEALKNERNSTKGISPETIKALKGILTENILPAQTTTSA